MLKAELSGAGAFLNLNPRAMGANERGSLGLIGGRNQGKWAALRAIEAGAEIRSPCDIDDAILGETGPALAKAQGREPLAVKDFRRVLDDKSIDAVIIATPDHWHTHIGLLACHAGKDVYIEKPLSQTVREGQMIRDAARKYSRIMQVGTQRRSGEHFASAADYVASGKLGKVCLVKAWMCQVRPSIGNPARSGPSTDGGLRCLARPRPQAAIQPESFPLQLALLLGLWQQ
jgi:predicted dehydrogenase